MKDPYKRLSSEWGSKARKADSRAAKSTLKKIPKEELEWDGMCPAGKHGLDFQGQPCDLCAKADKEDFEERYKEVVTRYGAYSKAVREYEEARDIYRMFSNKNRPPEVLAAYHRAQANLEKEKAKWP